MCAFSCEQPISSHFSLPLPLIVISFSGACAEYLRLSDLTAGYRRPSVADLKIGTQTFDDDAPAKKKSSELAKFPDQATLGFRFTGMKVFDAHAGAYVEYSKSFCHGAYWH